MGGYVISILSAVLFLVCWILIIKKLLVNRFAPVRTVTAEVCDKYKPDIVSKHPGTFKQQTYMVVFKTNNKKLSFNVSEFSYSNYKINDKGTLKYKGSQIISFRKF